MLSGNAKYEKILKKAKEKLDRGSQRDEAIALGEAVAAEPCMDDSGSVVSRALPRPARATLLRVTGAPAPCSSCPGPCWHWGPPCTPLAMDFVSSVCPRGCPPVGVVPPRDAAAPDYPREMLKAVLKQLGLWCSEGHTGGCWGFVAHSPRPARFTECKAAA